MSFAAIFLSLGDRHSLTSVSQNPEHSNTQNESTIRSQPNSSSRGSSDSQQDLNVVDIQGKWDFEQAQKIALSYLQKKNWNSVEGFCYSYEVRQCIPVHKALGDYNLIYRNREVKIVATSSIREGSDCHACSPYLSFFEFEKEPNGWKLTTSDLATLKWGQWGRIDDDNVKICVIGDNIYGIELQLTEVHRGIIDQYVVIFTKLGDSFQRVLDIEKSRAVPQGEYMENDSSWDTHIKPQPGTTGFFDILVETEGVRKGKSFHERKLFKFDGQKYIYDDLYQ